MVHLPWKVPLSKFAQLNTWWREATYNLLDPYHSLLFLPKSSFCGHVFILTLASSRLPQLLRRQEGVEINYLF